MIGEVVNGILNSRNVRMAREIVNLTAEATLNLATGKRYEIVDSRKDINGDPLPNQTYLTKTDGLYNFIRKMYGSETSQLVSYHKLLGMRFREERVKLFIPEEHNNAERYNRN